MSTPNAKTASRRSVQKLEWQVCEDDRAWEEAQRALALPSADPPATGSRAPRFWRRNALATLGALLVASSVGWWVWQRSEAGIAQLELELEAEIAAELWQHEQPSIHAEAAEASLLNALTMPPDSDDMVTNVEIRGLGADWAVVDVTIQPTTDAPSHRQTRVYRANDRGWTRTRASKAHWGTVRHLESEHFIFIFHTVDEAAVKQAAPQLDAFYPQVHNPLYKPLLAGAKLTITIEPEQRPGRIFREGQTNPGITVASPAAALLPADLSPGDALLQTLTLAIFNRLSIHPSEATVHSLPGKWYRLHNAARLWFIWEHELPLAIWRKPLVQWVLETPNNSQMRDAYAVPAFARELCTHHALWMPTPLDLHVPIHCSQRREGTKTISAWRYHNQPALQSLDILLYRPLGTNHDMGPYAEAPLPEPGPSAIMIATFFEYAAATYGKSTIPLLLANIPKHQSAATLIPATFGVPLSEFERGWHAFLVEQYELAE